MKYLFLSLICWSAGFSFGGGITIVNEVSLKLEKAPIWAAFQSNDRAALVLDVSGMLYAIDPYTASITQRSPLGISVALADASKDLNFLAVASENGVVSFFSLNPLKPLGTATLDLHRREKLVDLAYNQAQRRVIVLTSNGSVIFLSENGTEEARLGTRKHAVAGTLDHKGQYYYAFFEAGTVTRVDVTRMTVGNEFSLGTSKEEIKVKAVSLSKCDGVPLVAIGLDRFDKSIITNRSTVFSRPSDVHFTNAYLDEIRVFSLERNLVEKTMNASTFRDEITHLSFSPDGLWVASIHAVRKKVKLWDVKLSVEGGGFEHPEVPTLISFSQRGTFLMHGDASGKLTILSLEGVAPCGSDSYLANFRENGALTLPNDEPVSLALLPFDVEGTSIDAGRSVTRLVETLLTVAPNITLADRSDLDRLAAELKIQNTGLTDTATAARLGRMLNVKYLLMGSMARFGEKVVLILKLVEVETARVIGNRSLTCNRCGDGQIPEAVERLCMGIFSKKP